MNNYQIETTSDEDENRTNLIINYLPQSVCDEDLYKMFVSTGPIKTCRIMKDLKTGYSYGFGFVDFISAQDAARAISQFNNMAIEHKRIKVSYARPPGDIIKETNLYIQNIPRTYTLENLEHIFSPFGNIVQKNLLKDKITGYPRGVGFVRYDKKSEADAAIAAMNGTIPEGGTQALTVRLAEEHGKMKGAYFQGYQGGMSERGRGGGQNRGMMHQPGGFGRGGYNNSGGKIAFSRMNKRYNPMSGGGAGSFGGDYQTHTFSPNYMSF